MKLEEYSVSNFKIVYFLEIPTITVSFYFSRLCVGNEKGVNRASIKTIQAKAESRAWEEAPQQVQGIQAENNIVFFFLF